jgi:hypothetical protein
MGKAEQDRQNMKDKAGQAKQGRQNAKGRRDWQKKES